MPTPPICKQCGQPIWGNYITALGAQWHPEHFLCAGCGRPIGGASFQQHEGKPYHAACYLEYVAARCAYCGRPIEDKYIVHQGASYHPECYREHVVPRCVYCGKPLMGEYLIDYWGDTYCKEHKEQYPACAFCGRLIPPAQQEPPAQSHGSMRCPVCRSTAVETSAQAQPVFARLKQWVGSQGLRYNNLPIDLRLYDRSRLLELLKGSRETRALGVTLSTTQIQNGQPLHTDVQGVAVLQGMPATLFQGVIIHELGHVWLVVQNVRNLPLWAEEGFCQLLAHRYYTDLATNEAGYHATSIERDTDPIYGEGFRRVKAVADAMGFARLLETLQTTKRMPSVY